MKNIRHSTHLIAALMVVISSPALAHSGHGGGFSAGFLHPVTGADHVLAMLAVGLWAAVRGERSTLLWPAAFVTAMIAGFALAQLNVVVPYLEPMILSSVILLGAAIVLGWRAPVLAGAILVALAGLVHGYAHGNEVQGAVLPFAAGFSVSTTILHAAGLGIGISLLRSGFSMPVKLAGGLIMAAGAAITFS